MHIGGMRTAIYNWLYARQNNGQFILRIDDTDRTRHIEEALPSILHSLNWMKLQWDELYRQSDRSVRYKAAIDKLLDEGKAFNADGAIKLKMDPNWSSVVVLDEIRGRLEFPCDQYADGIPLCRADGSPLYNLATVVDDHLMEITHVIRAEEHLSNVAPQVLIAEALSYRIPVHVHIPFVKEPGSNLKFSKRAEYKSNPRFKKLVDIATKLGVSASPAHVEFYEQIGILPHALFNALVRTGWSYDGKTDYLSREEILEKFSLGKVNKSPAEFDPDKLLAYQAHWMNALRHEAKATECLRFIPDAGISRVDTVVTMLGQRIKLASDILDYPEFFCEDNQVAIDEPVFDLRLRKDKEAIAFLLALEEKLKLSCGAMDTTVEQCLIENNTTIGRMVHALRAAITGKASGPNIIEIMMVLGSKSCLNRISWALNR